jgi:hypothetical protein
MNERYVKRRYFEPNAPASFTAIGNFIRNNEHFKDKTDTLSDLKTYVMFAPVQRKFKRRRVIESFARITEGAG